MIFDSADQRERILNLIGEVPVTTNIAGLIAGPSDDLRALIAAIHAGIVMSPADQTNMKLWMLGTHDAVVPEDDS